MQAGHALKKVVHGKLRFVQRLALAFQVLAQARISQQALQLGGQRASEHGPDTWGLWCKKSVSVPGVQAQPRNRVPFDLEDAHFVVVALSVPLATSSGVVFQASRAEGRQCSEMALFRGQPQLRFVDASGQTVQLRSPLRLAPHLPVVLTLSCTAGLQQLRVNAEVVARSAATIAPSVFSQLLIGSFVPAAFKSPA